MENHQPEAVTIKAEMKDARAQLGMPKIRPYHSRDWDAFLELDSETGLASLACATGSERTRFRERWPALLKKTYGWGENGPTIGKSVLLVLEADGDYGGHLWLTEQEDFFTGQPKLFITTVALVAKYRGRGWGQLLMERAIEEARVRGLQNIGLGVDANNAGAIRLYEKLGFKCARLSMEKALV